MVGRHDAPTERRPSFRRLCRRPQPHSRAAEAGTDPIAAAASNQRSGGVKLVTPIELKVLQGDKVLGSTADGPIVAPAGTYQLDLSNAALGFRTRMSVTFRAGQIRP